MDLKTLEERRHAQPNRPQDMRTPFERDESRLIHSAAFRRLQSKTQVLGLGESDFYRTRLTHSMEVAQIGRGIVQNLKGAQIDELLPSSALITAICLAHDIGHPPFGHGGEVALNYCMRNHGGFEGNGQTLRILGKLDKYTERHGLNPTRRMLLGVLKYPTPYSALVNEDFYNVEDDPDSPFWLFKAKSQKPPKCYHDCDKEVVDFIFSAFCDEDIRKFTCYEMKGNKHSDSLYKSFDCSIMNLADNISYSLHDLEDALSLGMVTEKQWLNHFKENENLFNDLVKDGQERHLDFKTITDKLFNKESHHRKDTIGNLVNLMITNVEVIDNNSGCNEEILRLNVALKPKIELLRRKIFDLVLQCVILDENVQQLEFKGQRLIIELFQALAKDPERFLPKPTKKRWQEAGKSAKPEEKESEQLRVICDFVSGMTDDYATKYYEKLFVPSKGSIFDRL